MPTLEWCAQLGCSAGCAHRMIVAVWHARQVDAALDLSHTQNIGHMIRTHFPFSQFIVVSLKEGMFNNANVIFRTKFMDGVSAVTRTTNDARRCDDALLAVVSPADGAPEHRERLGAGAVGYA